MMPYQPQNITALTHQWAELPTDRINFLDSVRDACKSNLCGYFGRSWMCPPAVGSVAELATRCRSFDRAVVFSTCHKLQDSFDFEGMMDAMSAHKAVETQVRNLFSVPILVLTAGCCKLCDTCTYPDNPCANPAATPSLEACGIHVSDLAAAAGITYYNGENTVTYFSAILF